MATLMISDLSQPRMCRCGCGAELPTKGAVATLDDILPSRYLDEVTLLRWSLGWATAQCEGRGDPKPPEMTRWTCRSCGALVEAVRGEAVKAFCAHGKVCTAVRFTVIKGGG